MRAGEILAYDDTGEIIKQAKLLRETQISLPQISELGQRMTTYGMRDDILTVSEFCDGYSKMLVTSVEEETTSADRH